MAEKRALVLSGGGSKGAFAAGAIKHLMVNRRLHFDMAIGTSTGALLAPLVATRDVADLLNIYENVENQHVLTDRPDLLAFLLSDALNGSEPLERMIHRFLGEERRYRRLVESPMEMFVSVVSLQSGRVEYGNQHQDPKEVLLKKILASASIPVLMPPVQIGSVQFVDGGVKETAPFAKAIDEGATHIVAIVLQADAERRPVRTERFLTAFDITRRTIELLTEEILDNDLRVAALINEGVATLARIRANARDRLGLSADQIQTLFAGVENAFDGRRIIEITLIRPDRELAGSPLNFDPHVMREWVDLGYATARRALSAS
ncbi:hypothetical protein BH24GEM3_BH24GEM3_01870 [soil metagenome]